MHHEKGASAFVPILHEEVKLVEGNRFLNNSFGLPGDFAVLSKISHKIKNRGTHPNLAIGSSVKYTNVSH